VLGQATPNLCFLDLVGYAGHVVLSGAPGTHYAELVFLHLVGYVGHIVHSGASVVRNNNALFFMPGWDQCRFHKKHVRTRYAKLMLLHPVGLAGHIVHSGAS
jgi:hypothetical protein